LFERDIHRAGFVSSEQTASRPAARPTVGIQSRVRTEALTGRHYRIEDDPVYLWALGTWKLLRTEHPLQAKVLFGDAAYEEGYFMVAYSAGINGALSPISIGGSTSWSTWSADLATSAPNVHG
jgi:hypothetical protein